LRARYADLNKQGSRVKNMSEKKSGSSNVGRRQFLRSVFGLGGGLAEAQNMEAEAAPARSVPGKFIWCNLRNGQIGFPSGPSAPIGMPGSIMKLVAAAALTDAHLMSVDEKFECRGVYKLHNETYKCQFAHGLIDMANAIGLSCNVYFAHAAQKMSARTIIEYARKFGLDQQIGDFKTGKFPASTADNASSEKYVLGLAEDLQANALQIMRISAIIANDGKVPFLHSAELSGDGPEFELALSPQSWKILKEGMQIASRHGTGKKLDPENKLKLAIKTGTTPHGKSFQSWITGYFPWDHPRYAFVLRAPAGTSQDEAVPQARKFLFSAEWP
jgi:cell division protein FtsI/penicillin-binding protein 2